MSAHVAVWLLDIDGVINAFKARNGGKGAWPVYEIVTVTDERGYGWKFQVAPEVVTFINSQREQGTDIRWASTWCQQANDCVAPAVGLGELPVGAQPAGMSDHHYKQRAALELVRAGVPLVWTDDDAIDEWARQELGKYDTPMLLIEPHPSDGLTAKDCEAIAWFLEQHRQV